MSEFTTRRWPLFKAMKAAVGIVNKKATLPIIESIQIITIKKKSYLVATDLEVTLYQQIDFEGKKPEINIVFEPLPILKFLESIPKDIEQIVFIISNGELVLQAGFDQFSINLENFNDFPEVQELVEPIEIEFDRIELKNTLKTAIPFSSADELRPVMTGVYLDLNTEGGPYIVATDAHKLFRQRFCGAITVKADGPDMSIIFSKKTINALDKILDTDVTDKVTIAVSKDKSHIKVSDFEERKILYARLIDGTYPKWSAVIPIERDKVCSIRVSDLTGRLNMSQATSSNHGSCTIGIRRDKLFIEALNIDYARTYKAQFDIKSTSEINLGLNSYFMAECITAIGTDIVYLYFSQPNRAVVITKAKTVDPDEDFFMLLMPVMIDGTSNKEWPEPKEEVIEVDLLLSGKEEPKA